MISRLVINTKHNSVAGSIKDQSEIIKNKASEYRIADEDSLYGRPSECKESSFLEKERPFHIAEGYIGRSQHVLNPLNITPTKISRDNISKGQTSVNSSIQASKNSRLFEPENLENSPIFHQKHVQKSHQAGLKQGNKSSGLSNSNSKRHIVENSLEEHIPKKLDRKQDLQPLVSTRKTIGHPTDDINIEKPKKVQTSERTLYKGITIDKPLFSDTRANSNATVSKGTKGSQNTMKKSDLQSRYLHGHSDRPSYARESDGQSRSKSPLECKLY